MKLDELRIVVTGGASGIGRELCMALCQHGARVAALDKDADGLAELASAASGGPGELRTYQADVSRQDDVSEAVARIADELGSINGLVNNAGIYRDGLLVRAAGGTTVGLPLAQWQVVIDTDLTGPFLMTREVAAHMIRNAVRPGVVVNISSISRAGNPGQSSYAAAKAGVVADTVVWAEELARHGIRVGCLAPGFIRTPILDAMDPDVREGWIRKVPLQRLGEPAEIFAGVRFIIECDYFNGKCLEIDGGLRI